MNWVEPSAEELTTLRADPLLFEQELDVRPEVAKSLERALGFRSGCAHWRTSTGTLYAIELGDFGRGMPSMAIVYGFWPRFEPRPVDDAAIDEDLADFCLWMADVCDGLEVADVRQTLQYAMPSRRDQPGS
jgi:hypothetical protein